MKFLLDFDRTLFDTDKFVDQVTADGKEDLLASKEVWEHYQAVDFLFPDTLNFLESKNVEDIVIVTAVNSARVQYALSYQKDKVEQEPIISLVNEIVYVVYDKSEVVLDIAKQVAPEEQIVFVDDLLDQCLSVKRSLPNCHCFMLARKSERLGPVEHIDGVRVVYSLTELDAIIKTL